VSSNSSRTQQGLSSPFDYLDAMSTVTPTNRPIYLTLKEVADLLKVKPRTIYAWVSDKRIPFERKGGLLRFRLDAVLAWNEPAR